MTPPPDVVALIKALPLGSGRETAHGAKYVTTRTAFVDGRATKVVAEELGGRGYISLNLYDLSRGAQLYPCEMSDAKVITFLRSCRPDSPKI